MVETCHAYAKETSFGEINFEVVEINLEFGEKKSLGKKKKKNGALPAFFASTKTNLWSK